MNLKNISVLSKQEAQKIKGAYLFTCEEKKRTLMLVSVYSDSGSFLESYKVDTVAVDSFITSYGTKTK